MRFILEQRDGKTVRIPVRDDSDYSLVLLREDDPVTCVCPRCARHAWATMRVSDKKRVLHCECGWDTELA